ncbi:uncharacterized protein LOC116203045 isoform X2 [Punica granatum]|nr:uncharacterized protein LOC116203045 isoform X2 [Punica granatum]XP_031390566.1 uncharacterized protein LOC116203045 isoform X2 [Punica granatum]XP_031390567.1 uncharacterized protein LOC116203045 isoform X2 [Punica granatum]XP_031390568.1 uncharacterized protein LOC116203045 isoform X2 [Punica granatum]XP_031390569.1 uncharacterized protein LOC116203045 isoform X2 [Punica granatum]
MMENLSEDQVHNCTIKRRVNSRRFRDKVYVGCGAGFGGDRPLAALKLLQRVSELNYLVLECLAERTLADHYQEMMNGGDGFDSRISEWMSILLPLAVDRGVCIITNMGAVDPVGAQDRVLEVAKSLGLSVTVAVAREVALAGSGLTCAHEKSNTAESGISTYLGAAPIVECLEKYRPNVVVTSRIADAALFLGPMVYELGWNWDDFNLLAQGTMAGHLLECGCQLTGGYFMHPGDKYRDMPFSLLLNASLPYAEVSYDGKICVAKANGSGGVLNISTCSQQLLYEIGNPAAYVTPDVVIDVCSVTFQSISDSKVLCLGAKQVDEPVPGQLLRLVPQDVGWKGWGEISYGGFKCVNRAKAAEFLVRSWIEEEYPGLSDRVCSYIVGVNSLKATCSDSHFSSWNDSGDIRLRMDGLFEKKEHAVQFIREFTALYTNGPAGGGGISTGHKKEIILVKELVERDSVHWRTEAKSTISLNPDDQSFHSRLSHSKIKEESIGHYISPESDVSPAPSNQKIPLYSVAHSRAGDKGNDINFSIIPHCPSDVERLKSIITPDWVRRVVSPLLCTSTFPDAEAISKRDKWVSEHVRVEIYEVPGIHSLNIVARNILDGGVNCSRRIDRHGKSISDLVLCQQVILPP